jgi:hypothetical protein
MVTAVSPNRIVTSSPSIVTWSAVSRATRMTGWAKTAIMTLATRSRADSSGS